MCFPILNFEIIKTAFSNNSSLLLADHGVKELHKKACKTNKVASTSGHSETDVCHPKSWSWRLSGLHPLCLCHKETDDQLHGMGSFIYIILV